MCLSGFNIIGPFIDLKILTALIMSFGKNVFRYGNLFFLKILG